MDPNGEEVEILLGCGADEFTRQEALEDLQNAAPNLKLELRGDKLCIGEDGVAKTEYEKHLAEAINSSEFKSEIRLETLNYDQSGSYNGTKFEDNQYISKNSVDLKNTRQYEKETGSVRGCGLMHEITEGIEMGKIAKRENLPEIEKAWRIPQQQSIGKGDILVPDDIKGPHYQFYVEGHSLATPQPGTWNAKPKRFFK